MSPPLTELESIVLHWTAESSRLQEEVCELRRVIVLLLCSADRTWEGRDEGDDWAVACRRARKALEEDE